MKKKLLLAIVLLIIVCFSTIVIHKKNNIDYVEGFNKVSMNMDYVKVKALLGSGRKENINSDKVIYLWQNKGNDIEITFEKDRVINKANGNPVKKDIEINEEKYNKILTGMNYNKVKLILGEGELISESEYMDNDDSKLYSWINKKGRYITINFENNKVISKVIG